MVQLPAETSPHSEGSHSHFCKINFAIPTYLKRNRRHHQPGKEHSYKTQPATRLQDIVSSLQDRWEVVHGTNKNKSCKAFHTEKEVLYKKAESHQVKALKTLDRDNNICTQSVISLAFHSSTYGSVHSRLESKCCFKPVGMCKPGSGI